MSSVVEKLTHIITKNISKSKQIIFFYFFNEREYVYGIYFDKNSKYILYPYILVNKLKHF